MPRLPACLKGKPVGLQAKSAGQPRGRGEAGYKGRMRGRQSRAAGGRTSTLRRCSLSVELMNTPHTSHTVMVRSGCVKDACRSLACLWNASACAFIYVTRYIFDIVC